MEIVHIIDDDEVDIEKIILVTPLCQDDQRYRIDALTDYDIYYTRIIATNQLSLLTYAPSQAKHTQRFLNEVIYVVEFLQKYNKEIQKISRRYPYCLVLMDFLIQYVVLEMEVMNILEKPQEEVEQRVVGLLQQMFSTVKNQKFITLKILVRANRILKKNYFSDFIRPLDEEYNKLIEDIKCFALQPPYAARPIWTNKVFLPYVEDYGSDYEETDSEEVVSKVVKKGQRVKCFNRRRKARHTAKSDSDNEVQEVEIIPQIISIIDDEDVEMDAVEPNTSTKDNAKEKPLGPEVADEPMDTLEIIEEASIDKLPSPVISSVAATVHNDTSNSTVIPNTKSVHFELPKTFEKISINSNAMQTDSPSEKDQLVAHSSSKLQNPNNEVLTSKTVGKQNFVNNLTEKTAECLSKSMNSKKIPTNSNFNPKITRRDSDSNAAPSQRVSEQRQKVNTTKKTDLSINKSNASIINKQKSNNNIQYVTKEKVELAKATSLKAIAQNKSIIVDKQKFVKSIPKETAIAAKGSKMPVGKQHMIKRKTVEKVETTSHNLAVVKRDFNMNNSKGMAVANQQVFEDANLIQPIRRADGEAAKKTIKFNIANIKLPGTTIRDTEKSNDTSMMKKPDLQVKPLTVNDPKQTANIAKNASKETTDFVKNIENERTDVVKSLQQSVTQTLDKRERNMEMAKIGVDVSTSSLSTTSCQGMIENRDVDVNNCNFPKEAVNIAKNLPETIKKTDGKQEIIKDKVDVDMAIIHHAMPKRKPEINDSLITENPDHNIKNCNFRKEAVNLAKNLPETIKKTDGKQEAITEVIKGSDDVDMAIIHQATPERKSKINNSSMREKPKTDNNKCTFRKETVNLTKNLPETIEKTGGKQETIKEIINDNVDVAKVSFHKTSIQKKPVISNSLIIEKPNVEKDLPETSRKTGGQQETIKEVTKDKVDVAITTIQQVTPERNPEINNSLMIDIPSVDKNRCNFRKEADNLTKNFPEAIEKTVDEKETIKVANKDKVNIAITTIQQAMPERNSEITNSLMIDTPSDDKNICNFRKEADNLTKNFPEAIEKTLDKKETMKIATKDKVNVAITTIQQAMPGRNPEIINSLTIDTTSIDKDKCNFRKEADNLTKNFPEAIEKTVDKKETMKVATKDKVNVEITTIQQAMPERNPEITNSLVIDAPSVDKNKCNFRKEAVNLTKNIPEAIEKTVGKKETIKVVTKDKVDVAMTTTDQANPERKSEMNSSLMIEKPGVDMKKCYFRKEADNFAKNLPETIKWTDGEQKIIEKYEEASNVVVTKDMRKPEDTEPDVNIIKSKPLIVDKQKTNSKFREETVNLTKSFPRTIEKTEGKQKTVQEKLEIPKVASLNPTITTKPVATDTLINKPIVNTVDKQNTNNMLREKTDNLAKNLPGNVNKADDKQVTVNEVTKEKMYVAKATYHQTTMERKHELNDKLIIEKTGNEQKLMVTIPKEKAKFDDELSNPLKKTASEKEITEKIGEVNVNTATSLQTNIQNKPESTNKLFNEISVITCLPTSSDVDKDSLRPTRQDKVSNKTFSQVTQNSEGIEVENQETIKVEPTEPVQEILQLNTSASEGITMNEQISTNIEKIPKGKTRDEHSNKLIKVCIAKEACPQGKGDKQKVINKSVVNAFASPTKIVDKQEVIKEIKTEKEDVANVIEHNETSKVPKDTTNIAIKAVDVQKTIPKLSKEIVNISKDKSSQIIFNNKQGTSKIVNKVKPNKRNPKESNNLNKKLTGIMIDNSQATIKEETENEDILLESQMKLQPDCLKLTNRNENLKSIYLSKFDLQMAKAQSCRRNESHSRNNVGQGNSNAISEEIKEEQKSTIYSDTESLDNRHFDRRPHQFRAIPSREYRKVGAKSMYRIRPDFKMQTLMNVNSRRKSVGSSSEIDTDDFLNYIELKKNRHRHHSPNQRHNRMFKKGRHYDESRQHLSRRSSIYIRNKPKEKCYIHNKSRYLDDLRRQKVQSNYRQYHTNNLRYSDDENPSTSYEIDPPSNVMQLRYSDRNGVFSSSHSDDSYNENLFDESPNMYYMDSSDTSSICPENDNVKHKSTHFSHATNNSTLFINPLYKMNKCMDNNSGKSNWLPEQDRRTFLCDKYRDSVNLKKSYSDNLPHPHGNLRNIYQEQPTSVHHHRDLRTTSFKWDEPNFKNKMLEHDKMLQLPLPSELAYESNRFCIKQVDSRNKKHNTIMTNLKKASVSNNKNLLLFAPDYSSNPHRQVNKINILGNLKLNKMQNNSLVKGTNTIDPTIIKEEIIVTEPSTEVNIEQPNDSTVLQTTLIEIENINKSAQQQKVAQVTDEIQENCPVKSQDSAKNIPNINEKTTMLGNVSKRRDIIKTSLIMSEIIPEDSISNNAFDNKQPDENSLMDDIVCNNMMQNKNVSLKDAIIETIEYSVNECQESIVNGAHLNSDVGQNESYQAIQTVHECSLINENNKDTNFDVIKMNANVMEPCTNVKRQDIRQEEKDMTNSQINEPEKEAIHDEESNCVKSANFAQTDNPAKEISIQVESYESLYPKIMEILSRPTMAKHLESRTDLNEEKIFQTLKSILPNSGKVETENHQVNNITETEAEHPTEHNVIDESQQNPACEILPAEVPEISDEINYNEAINFIQLDMMEGLSNDYEHEMITLYKGDVTKDFNEKEEAITKDICTSYPVLEELYNTISDDKMKVQSEDSSGSITVSINDSISLDETSNEDVLFGDTVGNQKEQVSEEILSEVAGMCPSENIMETITENREDEKNNDIPLCTEDIRSQANICEIDKGIIKESEIVIGTKKPTSDLAEHNVENETALIDKNISSINIAECNVESKTKSNDKNVIVTSNEPDLFAVDEYVENEIHSQKTNKDMKTIIEGNVSKSLNTDTGLSNECLSEQVVLDKECVNKKADAAPFEELFSEDSLDSLKSTPRLQIDTSSDDSSNDRFLIEYVAPPAKKAMTKKNYDESRSAEIDQDLWKDLEEAIYIQMMSDSDKRTSRAAKTRANARLSTVKLKDMDDSMDIWLNKSNQYVEKMETRGMKRKMEETRAAAATKAKDVITLKTRVPIAPKTRTPNTRATAKSKTTAIPKPKLVVKRKLKAKTNPQLNVESTPKANVEETPKAESRSKLNTEIKMKPKVEGTPKHKVAAKSKPKAEETPKPNVVSTPKRNTEATPKLNVKTTPKSKTVTTPKRKVEVSSKPEVPETPKPQVEATPTLNVEGTLKLNVETTSTPNVESTPKQKTEETPKLNVEITPNPNVEATPKRNADTQSKLHVETTPKPNVESTPKQKADESPKLNVEITPNPNVQATPKRNRETTTKRNGESTPELIVETTSRPTADVTPKRSAESTPKLKVEATSKPTVEATTELQAKATPKLKAAPKPKATSTRKPKEQTTSKSKAKIITKPIVEAIPEPKAEAVSRVEATTPNAEAKQKLKAVSTPKPKVVKTRKSRVTLTAKPKAVKIPKPRAPRKPRAARKPKAPRKPRAPRKPKAPIGPKRPRGRPKKIKVVEPSAKNIMTFLNDGNEVKFLSRFQEEPEQQTVLETPYPYAQETQELCPIITPRISVVQQHSLNTLAAVACDMLEDFNEQNKYINNQTPKFQQENDDSDDSYEGKLVISDEIKEDVQPENIQCSVIKEVKEAMLEKPITVKPACEPLIQPEIVPPVDCEVKKPTDHRIDVILGNIAKDEATGVFEHVDNRQDIPLRRSFRSKSELSQNTIEPTNRRASADSHDHKSIDVTNLFKIYEAKSDNTSMERTHEVTLKSAKLLHEQQYGNVQFQNLDIGFIENHADRLQTIPSQSEEQEVQAVDLSCKEHVRERDNQRKSEYTTYNVAPNPSESIIINYKVDCGSNLDKERLVNVNSRNLSRNHALRHSISKEPKDSDVLLKIQVKDSERKLIENLCRDESVSITRINYEPPKYVNEVQSNVIVQNKFNHKSQPKVCNAKDIIVHESVVVKSRNPSIHVQNEEQISHTKRQDLEPNAVLTPITYQNPLKRKCSPEVEHLIKKLKINPELAVDAVDTKKDKKTVRTPDEKRKSINDVLVRLSTNNQEKMKSQMMPAEDMAEITLVKLNADPAVRTGVSNFNKHEEPAKLQEPPMNMAVSLNKNPKEPVVNVAALHVKKPKEPVINMDFSHIKKLQEPLMYIHASHNMNPLEPPMNMAALHMMKQNEPVININVPRVKKLQELVNIMGVPQDNQPSDLVRNLNVPHIQKPKGPSRNIHESHVKKLQENVMNMAVSHDSEPKKPIVNMDVSRIKKLEEPIMNLPHDKIPNEPALNIEASLVNITTAPVENIHKLHVKKLQETVINMAASHKIKPNAPINMDVSHIKQSKESVVNMAVSHCKNSNEPINMAISHDKKLNEVVINMDIKKLHEPVVDRHLAHVEKLQETVMTLHSKEPNEPVLNMATSHVTKPKDNVKNMDISPVKKPIESVMNTNVSHIQKLPEPITDMTVLHAKKLNEAVLNVDVTHLNEWKEIIVKPNDPVLKIDVSNAKIPKEPVMNMNSPHNTKLPIVNMDVSHLNKTKDPIVNTNVPQIKKLPEPTMNTDVLRVMKLKEPAVNTNVPYIKKLPEPIMNMAVLNVKKPEEPALNMDVSQVKKRNEPVVNTNVSLTKNIPEPIMNMAVMHDKTPNEPVLTMGVSHVKESKETAVKLNKPALNMDVPHVKKSTTVAMNTNISLIKKLPESIHNMSVLHDKKPNDPLLNIDVSQVKKPNEPVVKTNVSLTKNIPEPIMNMAVKYDKTPNDPVLNMDVSHVNKSTEIVVNTNEPHIKKVSEPVMNMAVLHVKKPNEPTLNRDVFTPKESIVTMDVSYVKKLKETEPSMESAIATNVLVVEREKQSIVNKTTSPVKKVKEPFVNMTTPHVLKEPAVENNDAHVKIVSQVMKVQEPVMNMNLQVIKQTEPIVNKNMLQFRNVQHHTIPKEEVFHVKKLKDLSKTVYQFIKLNDRDANIKISQANKPKDLVYQVNNSKQLVLNKELFQDKKMKEPAVPVVLPIDRTSEEVHINETEIKCEEPVKLNKEITCKPIDALTDFTLPDLSVVRNTDDANAIVISHYKQDTVKTLTHIDEDNNKSDTKSSENEAVSLGPLMPNNSLREAQSTSLNPSPSGSSDYQYPDQDSIYNYGEEYFITPVDENIICKQTNAESDGDYINNVPAVQNPVVVEPMETEIVDIVLKQEEVASLMSCNEMQSYFIPIPQTESQPPAQVIDDNDVAAAETSPEDKRQPSHETGHEHKRNSDEEYSRSKTEASSEQSQSQIIEIIDDTDEDEMVPLRSNAQSESKAKLNNLEPYTTRRNLRSRVAPPPRKCSPSRNSPLRPVERERLSAVITGKDIEELVECNLPKLEELSNTNTTRVEGLEDLVDENSEQVDLANELFNYVQKMDINKLPKPKGFEIVSNEFLSTLGNSRNRADDCEETSSNACSSKSLSCSAIPSISREEGYRVCSPEFGADTCFTRIDKSHISRQRTKKSDNRRNTSYNNDNLHKRTTMSPRGRSMPSSDVTDIPAESSLISTGTSIDSTRKRSSTSSRDSSMSSVSAPVPVNPTDSAIKNSASFPVVHPSPSCNNAPRSSDSSRKRSYNEHFSTSTSESVAKNTNPNTESSDHNPRKRTAMSSISNNFTAPVPDFHIERSTSTLQRRRSIDRSKPSPYVSSTSRPNYIPIIDLTTNTTPTSYRYGQRNEHSFRPIGGPSNHTRRPRSRQSLMSSMSNEQINGMSNIRSGNPRIPVHPERPPPEKSDLQWLDKISVAIPDLAKQPDVFFKSGANDS